MSLLPTVHPLEPLTVAEIEAAVALIRQEQVTRELVPETRWRFPVVTLREPAKSVVQAYRPGNAVPREAFVVLLDNQTGNVYEAIASLTENRVTSWQHIPGVQPNIMADELAECEAAVKAHPDFQAGVARRGLELETVVVDPWAIGNYGLADEVGQRLSRCLCYVRSRPESNFYARPIDGLVPVVDLNKMTVVRIEDGGNVPVPPESGEYAREFYQSQMRQDIKPLSITQSEGPSFTIEGHLIRWQRWQIRIGFTPREGLVLYQVGYEEDGRLRSILYRASMAEMVVPYGDPRPQHFRKNAFDLGEHGVGMLANSLTNGCDCFGEIRYFDAVLTDSRGQVTVTENAVCLHEEDYGILWKHTDWRRDHVDVRRSRRLVLSFIATVDNYEYGFYWYFYQDGTIQYEVKLTGILLAAALADEPRFGTLVAPEVNALNHQHFFAMRLDFDVDGSENSVYEVNSVALPLGTDNPYGNGWYGESTLLESEHTAQRFIDPLVGRYWKVVNPQVHNRLGQPVGFKLIPGENVLPFAHPDAPILKRAAFITRHLWVTPYHPDENFPAGPYPNQHPGGEGLPKWTASDRPLANTDVVLWYVFGHHHIPRPEDWPVMPVAYSGFTLKPLGFFDQNPALDVPPSPPKSSCH